MTVRPLAAVLLACLSTCTNSPEKPALADAVADAAADATDATAHADFDATELPATPSAVQAPHALLADPLIATGFSGANVGSSYPGAARPFGLVKASPDTLNVSGQALGALHCGGYQYADPYIYGITHNHLQGTGVPDYGNLAVMPFTQLGADLITAKTRKSTYSHATEEAEPGYYAVTLDGPHARAEVTATLRCAHHRLTFLQNPALGGVALDLAAALTGGKVTAAETKLDPANQTVTGTLHNFGDFSGRYGGFDVHFSARFSRPWHSAGTWTGGEVAEGKLQTQAQGPDGVKLGAWARFDVAADPTVELQVCLSYVDLAGAQAAMAAELPGFDFNGTRKSALLEWEAALGQVEVSGGTQAEQVIFYSSLYRAYQMPTLWSDVDGRYRGFDGKVHEAKGFRYVTDLSLWDTFRTENPLLVFLQPAMGRDVLRSLQAMAEDGGWLPKWAMGMGDTGSMIGQHSASVIADGYLKGVTDVDIAKLYTSLRTTAMGPQPPGSYGGRDCIEDYLAQGWCARDKTKGSVSKTLEYAFNDFCLAGLASQLGKPEDAQAFAARAKNYAKLWDPDSKFFRARTSDGKFFAEFNPRVWDFENPEYVEGTAWHWRWFVPHDPAGLQQLFGGPEAMTGELQTFFEEAKKDFNFYLPGAYYFHGNEPDMLAMTLFLQAGRPDLADEWTRWVGDANYTTAPDGLVGNDDAGTLSAWYVFAAMGLLPRPCVPGYDLVAPRFDQVTLHLAGGKVVVEAPGASQGGKFGGVTWNGQPLPGRWIDHALLIKGGKLVFLPAK